MERLDKVVGPANWTNEFREGPGGGVICKLSLCLNGVWISKEDGADRTNIEATKGGLSGSMKRAAVQWGIGRYLYSLKEGYAVVSENGSHYQAADRKNNKYQAFKWDPPTLPPWALPSSREEQPQQPNSQQQQQRPTQGQGVDMITDQQRKYL
jgi:hypothetical protein